MGDSTSSEPLRFTIKTCAVPTDRTPHETVISESTVNLRIFLYFLLGRFGDAMLSFAECSPDIKNEPVVVAALDSLKSILNADGSLPAVINNFDVNLLETAQRIEYALILVKSTFYRYSVYNRVTLRPSTAQSSMSVGAIARFQLARSLADLPTEPKRQRTSEATAANDISPIPYSADHSANMMTNQEIDDLIDATTATV